MELETIIALITNNGLAIGVVVYLLWERTKFMDKITECLTKLEETTALIKNYIMGYNDNDNK